MINQKTDLLKLITKSIVVSEFVLDFRFFYFSLAYEKKKIRIGIVMVVH